MEKTDKTDIPTVAVAGGLVATAGGDREVTFISIHWSRLLAGGIFVLTGLLDFHYLGYAIGNHTGTGSALVLGGPSFFWLIGMPIIAIGGILILYFLVSALKYSFKFDAQGSSFDAKGKWLCLRWSYHISPITRITYQRHRLGPKTIWIGILVPWIVWIIEYGAGLFDLPRSVSNTLPTMMILTAISDATALAVLIFFMPSSLRVYAPDKVYEFWISCPPRNDVVRRYFRGQPFAPPRESNQGTRSVSPRLVTGALLCAGCLLGLFADVLFGEWFSTAGLVYGIVLVLEGFFLEFHQHHVVLDPVQGSSRYVMHERQNAINYHIDIAPSTGGGAREASSVPAWHIAFIGFLLVNAAIQLVLPLRFGAVANPLSVADYITSIAFLAFTCLGFYKLVQDPRATTILFVVSLVAGLVLGLCL